MSKEFPAPSSRELQLPASSVPPPAQPGLPPGAVVPAVLAHRGRLVGQLLAGR